MKKSDFNYLLPEKLIAQTPIEPRDMSRLMVLDKKTGGIAHTVFNTLENYLKNIKELSQTKEKMRAQIKEKENVINDLKCQLKELQEQYEDISNEFRKNKEIMLNDKKQLINSVKQK